MNDQQRLREAAKKQLIQSKKNCSLKQINQLLKELETIIYKISREYIELHENEEIRDYDLANRFATDIAWTFWWLPIGIGKLVKENL